MKKLLLLGIIPALALLLLTTSHNIEALESNTEYFVDSKNAFTIISVDASGKTSLLEGGFVVNGEWEYWDIESLKISRILNDGDQGRFFGRSDAGNLFYAKYDIQGENADMFIKVWHDGIKTRILDKAVVSFLFD